MAECAIDNVYEDNVMTVYYVPIRKKGLGSETRSFESNKGQTVYDELSSRNPSRTDKKISKSRNPECSKITMDEDDIDYYAHERKAFSKKSKKLNCPKGTLYSLNPFYIILILWHYLNVFIFRYKTVCC